MQFQQKLIHEMERYQELADSKEALAARWAALIGSAVADGRMTRCRGRWVHPCYM